MFQENSETVSLYPTISACKGLPLKNNKEHIYV